MAQIGYTNKVALNENPEILDINKITDDDMNEIKQVVNDNYNNTIQITDTEPTDSDNKIWIDTSALSQSDETNMKYNDNGEYKDIYVKAFDTLPIGTEVNFNGTAQDIPNGWTQVGTSGNLLIIEKTSQYIEGGAILSNTYGTSQIDGYTQDFINGTILYDNSSGTETTFQLSDDVENYRCIEITYGYNASSTFSRSSTKLFDPDGKRASLFLQISGTSNVYILVANVEISHTTMTITNSREISISNNAYPTLDTNRLISVFKVIGYK